MQRICQEIRIKFPGGLIAGKWWGPENKRPIVALHGWQDNCGTFDKLIPHLPPHIPVLALDFPGHGRSYRLPPGNPYHLIHGVIFMKTLFKYFGWEKMSLMGHSMAAWISFLYTSSYPNEVDFLICMDGVAPLVNRRKMERIAMSIKQFIKYDAINNRTDEPPSYSFEDLAAKLHTISRKSISLETAKHILERNVAPSEKQPGEFYLNKDARLNVGPLEIPDASELIRCGLKMTPPVFVSKADDSSFYNNESIFMEVCDSIKKASKDFQFHRIAGTHHLHLNEPESVAGLLNNFIAKHDIEDRSCGGLKSEMKI